MTCKASQKEPSTTFALRKSAGLPPTTFAQRKSGGGFTLVEMLVSMAVFLIIGGAIINLLFSAIAAQRNTLAKQEVVDQISFTAEYMSRAIRQAQKDLVGACLTSGTKLNYEVLPGGELRFLDRDNTCREFSLATNAIQERRSTNHEATNLEPGIALTSSNIEVGAMRFFIQGEEQIDTLQPRVTFFVDAEDLQLQTTISQRRFDVQE